MLKGNPNVFHYTTFATADKLFAQHPIWQQAKVEAERRLIFEEYVAELKQREMVRRVFPPSIGLCLHRPCSKSRVRPAPAQSRRSSRSSRSWRSTFSPAGAMRRSGLWSPTNGWKTKNSASCQCWTSCSPSKIIVVYVSESSKNRCAGRRSRGRARSARPERRSRSAHHTIIECSGT